MHTYILRVWINGIQPQESRYRVSGIAVPENWNGGAIWAGFFILEKIDFFANNVNEIGFEKATEVKYPKAEGSAIKQKWTKQEEELLIREYSKGL